MVVSLSDQVREYLRHAEGCARQAASQHDATADFSEHQNALAETRPWL
jgi:hypothetical protein